MTEQNDPNTGPDLDTTGEAEARSQQRRKLRDRMSDVGLIATMAFATIVAVGAVLAWALFTGDNHKSDLGSTSAKPSTQTVEVSMGEFWFKPSKIDVKPNTTLILKVTNDGTQTHDLKVGAKQTPVLKPGQTATLKTTAIEATTQGYCTIPGHRAAGMVFDVNVIGATGAKTQQVSQGANTGVGEGINPQDAKIDPQAEPPKGFKAVDPTLAPAPGGTVHNLTFEATDVEMEVAPGVKQLMWTFNDTVPGPTLRGKVGDVFNVKLVNKGSIGHSLDFHASQVDPSRDMRTIQPGESLMYSFKAEHSGAWMYHCGTGAPPHRERDVRRGDHRPGRRVGRGRPRVLPGAVRVLLRSAGQGGRSRKGHLGIPGRRGVQRVLQPVHLRPDRGEGR